MICVFDIGNENYVGNGDAVLTPTECRLRNVAGGSYDLTMTHPIDPEGKWKHLVPGAVVKAPVPREEIENAFAGYAADVYKTNTDAALREGMSEPTPVTYATWQASGHTYVVGDKCTYYGRNYQCILADPKTDRLANHPPDNYPMYWKEISRYTAGAAVLVTLPAGSELYFVEDMDGTWYKMSTYYGIIGYIKADKLTFYRHLSPTETLPRIITEQLFRIEKPTVDTKNRTVSVTASHISYDLAGILVDNVSLSQVSPAMAIGRITEAFMMEYPGTIATNLTADDNGTYTNTIKGKNGIFALLDPDKGIVSTFDAAFKRDNWDLFVMKRTETDSGYRIRYRKNMLGVNWAQDSSGLVTRVVPVAKDANGDDLYLPEKWVDSGRIGDYPIVRMEYLTVSGQVGKDDGTGTSTVWTEEALLAEMRTKAAERFSVDKADRVGVTVTVDFVQLGSTEEYREYRDMENVLLYDTVTVQNEEIGLSVQLYVSEWEWDAIRRKTTAVKLINAMNYMKGTVAGYNVQAKSIGSDKLADDVAANILSQARDMMPEYQDSGSYGPTLANSKENAGIVAAGSGNAGKVWKTDSSGNPGWRDESITATAIQANDDLNTYKTPGMYYSTGSSISSTLSNIPSAMSDQMFTLEVQSDGGNWFQVIYAVTSYAGYAYIRKTTSTGTVWGDWQRTNFTANSKTADGIVTKGQGQANKVWKTDAEGNPAWRDDADTPYTLPLAANGTRGGVQIGYSESGRNYALKLSSEKGYVTVPEMADTGYSGDIDDLMTAGRYYIGGGSSTAMGTSNMYGTLLVIANSNGTGNRATQLFCRVTGSGSDVWYRRYDGSWQAPEVMVRASDIYNALDKTAAGFALDARQGKALSDRLTYFEGVAIPANADMNTYKTPGSYYSTGQSISSTLSNIPTSAADQMFILQVFSDGNNYFQTLTYQTSYVSNIYIRRTGNSGTTWQAWQNSTPVIMNNLTTTTAGYVLDATQGKALNDKLEPAVSTSGLTFGKCTLGAGGYAKIGKLVVVQISVTISEAVAAYTTFMSGFPAYGGASDAYVGLNNSKDSKIFYIVGSSGAVRCRSALASGDPVTLTGAYICL